MTDLETPITTQEQFDSMIKDRLDRERKKFADYDQLKTDLATAQKTIEEATAQRTALQKEIETLNGTVSGMKTEALKTSIAIEMGIPLELRSRLAGTTEEEIRADADALSKFIGKPAYAPPLKSNEPPAADSKDAAYKQMLQAMKN